MKVRLDILRRRRGETEGRWQSAIYETADENATVATALSDLNARDNLTDAQGRPMEKIEWECSCLQKKCGACAMVINGKPGLACDRRLRELGGGAVRLEPLKKFPVVADLIVDRSALYEDLKAMKLWLEEPVRLEQGAMDMAYEASRCLQCGCCLEVCPNFLPGDRFLGTAAMVPAARLLAQLPRESRRALSDEYNRRVYEGCGKSLSCRDICPAGIDVEGLMVNSNAIAVWKRLFPGKK